MLMTNAKKTAHPYVNTTDTTLQPDILSAVPVVSVLGSGLRAGMVLVDPELETPAVELDHRTRSARGSGEVSFLAYDYEVRNWATVSVRTNALVKVMAS